MAKGAIASRARDVLIVKKLNKCTLIILVSSLFLTRQHPVWYLNNKNLKTTCLHEKTFQFFKNGHLIGRKKV